MIGRPHLLIVGGTGVFGSRLARLLARKGGFRLTLMARDAARAEPLLAELRGIDSTGEFGFFAMERDKLTADKLRELGPAVLVDCSGPFQLTGDSLVETAIAARCHYLDLADSRAFVGGIARFDNAARAHRVVVLSGVSSTPALTHAVLDTLTAGWAQIDSVDVAIVPGNQTPKGRAVVGGILSWVGQSVRVFRDGVWQEGHGWGERRRVVIEGLKPRKARLADVPDLDLLAARYKVKVRAGFDAGLELGILDWLIACAGWLVRHRIVPSARLFTGIGLFIANRLGGLGTDAGGMLIEAAGLDKQRDTRFVRWTLKATNGDGPYVPVLAAAALCDALTHWRGPLPGARAAAGVVTWEQIKPWLDELSLEVKQQAFRKEVPLYRRVMGEAFATLPPVTQKLHRGRPAVVASGEAVVAGASGWLGKIVARWFGLPPASDRTPVRVVIESRDGREHWTRDFGGRPMRSVMHKAADGLIEERFGPVRIRMRLEARPDGLDMIRHSGSFGALPLPAFLLPHIKAEERVDEAGRHRFDVDIALPVIGRLVAYRGYLIV